MTEKTDKNTRYSADFAQQVGIKAQRKIKARQRALSPVWFGLGMMGLVGWSVVIPTLLGAALGLWLDEKIDDEHSWALALIVAGLILGCFNAWYWIAKEEQSMHDEPESSESEKNDDE
jgi:ATP synthase protein I